MSKINWNRPKYVFDGITIEREKPKKDSSFEIPEIHKKHNLKVEKGSGPHHSKLVCITCKGKFIRWLNSEQAKSYK